MPKVVGISADSTTPSRPLVPAPTKITRPSLRSASTMMSTPMAMRGRSRWTAASTLRSSFSISSMMSARRRLVDAERCGVDGFGGELLIFRTLGHRVSRNVSATKGRMLPSAFDSVNRPSDSSTAISRTSRSSGVWPITRLRATAAICNVLENSPPVSKNRLSSSTAAISRISSTA